MFGTSKKIEELKKSLEAIEEKISKNENFPQINETANNKPQNQNFTSEQIKQAAFALNLCTVSVSQIIDYSDLNILEQEYEAILNNLNLENFPKDEAFLDVLKHLLDTITFFRIQEGDKKFIEKEYQQKMKNAIWSAVPNFGVIIAGGLNPVSLGIALASQVGIGYMNYRKQKSQNDLEYEKQKWQLERSAIEQFNGLRRELFTTAWKIADNYNFPDEYRLTEKQIAQYDEILMDSNLFRKYERLESIKDKFEAYPPFWYFLGNAANSIAQEFLKEDSYFKNDEALFFKKDEIVSAYTKKAIDAFEKFESVNNMPLLRTDEFAASCALEHIDLLDFNNDAEKIRNLLQIALEYSENKNDVKQLCAMDYIKLGDYENAQKIFINLVAEDFNANTNAQILSQIYIADELKNHSGKYLPDYLLLRRFVNSENVFPWPNENQNSAGLMQEFLEKQKEKLAKEYLLVIKSVLEKYTIQFNRKFQTPDYNQKYEDSYFLDSDEIAEQRKFEFKQKNTSTNFSSIGVEYIDTLNLIVEALQKTELPSASNVSLVKESVAENKELQNAIFALTNPNGQNLASETENLFKIKISSALEKYLFEIVTEIKENLFKINEFKELIKCESLLANLCAEENIDFPEILVQNEDNSNEKSSSRLIGYNLLGADVEKQKQKIEQMKKQFDILKDFSDKFQRSKKADFYLKGTSEFSKYFAGKKLGNSFKNLLNLGEILAVLDDRTFSNHDLYFTSNAVYKTKKNFPDVVYCYDGKAFYSELRLSYDDKNRTTLKNSYGIFYEFKQNIDFNLLFSFIEKLAKNENKEFSAKESFDNLSLMDESSAAKSILSFFTGSMLLGPAGGVAAFLLNKKQSQMEEK